MGFRRNVTILIALQVVYLAAELLLGRFIGGDEIAYKAAGREWARSGNFIAPELRGFAAWRDPAHPYDLGRGFGPPLYTFSFGLFVKMVGFTPTTNVAFDALMHILLGWATWTLARALGPQLPYEAAMIAAAATLPLTTGGRPDEMGALLAMFGSALLLRSVSARRAAAAGALFGLSAGTSLVAAVILTVWPLRAFVEQRRRGAIAAAAVFAICAAIVFFLAMLPMIAIMPNGIAQLAHHAGDSVRTTYSYAIANSLRYGRAFYFAAGAALVVAAAHFVQALRRRSWSEWAALWLPPLAALGALLVFLPVKYYYVWIVDPSLFAAAACALAMLPWRLGARIAVAAIALLFWCAAASRFAIMSLVRATFPPGQTMSENVALIHRTIPPGSGVMTYDFWPALAGSSYRTYSTEANPRWEDVDYIVLTGNGSGAPGQPQTLRPEQLGYVQQHYAPLYDNLNRKPFRIGPIRTNSAWGYGPLILKRIR
jgi:hypothetical protein